MSEAIDRSYPGDLAADRGDTFRNAFNADREDIYDHTQALEAMVELALADLTGNGTLPSNTAECYVDDPVEGRVYCEVGYKAVIGAAVETTAIISQEYTAEVDNYVFLSLATTGILSLRVSESSTPQSNDILIAMVDDVGAIDNWPEGKIFAGLSVSGRMPTGDVTVGINHSMIVADDYEIATGHVLELLTNSVFEIT